MGHLKATFEFFAFYHFFLDDICVIYHQHLMQNAWINVGYILSLDISSLTLIPMIWGSSFRRIIIYWHAVCNTLHTLSYSIMCQMVHGSFVPAAHTGVNRQDVAVSKSRRKGTFRVSKRQVNWTPVCERVWGLELFQTRKSECMSWGKKKITRTKKWAAIKLQPSHIEEKTECRHLLWVSAAFGILNSMGTISPALAIIS